MPRDRIGHRPGVASPRVTPEPSIVIARGARAAEAYLLGELRRLHDAARADWSLLAQPVRVVVPSRSLRDHLAARLVRELGGAAAGIAIQTLRALAHELLERAGAGARGGQALVPVLVRRFAAEEPPLAGALGGFDDGFGVALASVNDLLDAGLDASNAESALECLAEAGPRAGAAAGARAEALVRVTERVAAELAARGLEPRAGFFRRARECFERSPTLLPSRAFFLHGWADVTGVQLDLVEALVRHLSGRAVLDHPPDPAGDEGVGERWTERLRLRLGAVAEEVAASPPAAALDGLEASGTHAEARAVARAHPRAPRRRRRAGVDRHRAARARAVPARASRAARAARRSVLGERRLPRAGGPPQRGVARAAGARRSVSGGSLARRAGSSRPRPHRRPAPRVPRHRHRAAPRRGGPRARPAARRARLLCPAGAAWDHAERGRGGRERSRGRAGR